MFWLCMWFVIQLVLFCAFDQKFKILKFTQYIFYWYFNIQDSDEEEQVKKKPKLATAVSTYTCNTTVIAKCQLRQFTILFIYNSSVSVIYIVDYLSPNMLIQPKTYDM